MQRELNAVWNEMISESGGLLETTEIEIRGQQLKTFAQAPSSLRDVWLLVTGSYGTRDYIAYEDEGWTYSEALAESAGIANWMLAHGIGPGDRVALAFRNYPEWMLSYWALTSIGVAVVGMNAWWVTDELDYALSDSTPKAIICDKERYANIEPLRDKHSDLLIIGVRFDVPSDVISYSVLSDYGGEMPDAVIDGDDDACIFYTSGTTGRPKGAQLTHRGCVLNIMNIMFMTLAQQRALARVQGGEDQLPDMNNMPVPVTLVTTPLFHVTANNCAVQPSTLIGGKIVHMYRWDAGEALRLIERHKISGVTGVPVMAREIINHPDFDKYDTTSLMSLGGGGAPLQPDLVGKINARLSGGMAGTGYGMTETCGIITAISGNYFSQRPESAGRLVPTLLGKCVDEAGNEVAQGEVGEVWVKGANVIKGYLNHADTTAESITDGWLHTGDIGRFDSDGYLFLVDRTKDMVLRGGENVYSAEVEAAIFSHDSVAECAVFGVPDDRLGEEVAAAIVFKSGSAVSADDMRTHCSSLLAKFKIPRYIWILDEALPRNASGKFLKRQLRDTLALEDAQ